MEMVTQKKPKRKLSKLRAFKTIQRNFALIGITPKLASQSYPLNVAYLVSVGFLFAFSLFILMLKVKELFELINQFDGIINMSK